MMLAIGANKGWIIRSDNIKNTYLQGIDRLVYSCTVYMEPPDELKRPSKLWKLKKSVYGMNDAGRKWYLKVEKAMTGLGCAKSQYDHCLFTYTV